MLGAVCGDIIGSPYEFNNTKSYDFELLHEGSKFTDDSVMTLAVARALLDVDGDISLLAGACESRFREFGLAHLDVGYGGMFRNWLLDADIGAYGSWGNGSAMRVSPVAWFYDSEDNVLDAAEATCLPTHGDPEGIRGAKAVALATFMARQGANKDEIRKAIERKFYYSLSRSCDELRPTYSFDVSCAGSVPVALRAFWESEDWEDCVRRAISVGGDSDTIGAMAGGIAEAFYGGVPQNIAEKCRELLSSDLREALMDFEYAARHRNEPYEKERVVL